jgi:hypothetical protein
VVDEMRGAHTAPHVQEAGCRALARLTECQHHQQVSAASAGAVEAVVNALCTHGVHAGVQAAGCAALWSLAGNAACRLAAVRAGAIEAVVAALRLHGGAEDVQEHGYRALHCLVTVQATTMTDVVLGVEAAARALCDAEQSVREAASAAFALAVTLLVGVAEASGAAAQQRWARITDTCGRMPHDVARAFAGKPQQPCAQ